MKSRFGKWCKRLNCTRRLDICERNREEHSQARVARKILEHVDVSPNQSRLRDHAHGLAKLRTDFQTTAREFVLGFDRNIRIGSEREDDLRTFPRRLHQLFTQKLRRIHLRDDLAIEIS